MTINHDEPNRFCQRWLHQLRHPVISLFAVIWFAIVAANSTVACQDTAQEKSADAKTAWRDALAASTEIGSLVEKEHFEQAIENLDDK